jgi:hypothetical protein
LSGISLKKSNHALEGEYCIWLVPILTGSKGSEENLKWFFDIRDRYRKQEYTTDVSLENNPQVIRLLAELEPGVLLLNTYEYLLPPEIEEAFWRVALQGRKYGIRTIKVETREQGLALSHALDRYKIVDLFDYQTQN